MTRTEKASRHGAPADASSARAGASPIAHDLATPPRPLSAKMLLGRSLFPIVTLVLIAGTFVWGSWVTLGLAIVTWNIVGRLG